MLKPKIVVILGPTASGKSALAVKIAKKFNGEVVSADSRQVYKGLNIGTGKITKKETAGIPHHLLDVASPKKVFTVVEYQKLAKNALQKILQKGKLPIICGGTGFYIDALINEWHLPPVPPQSKLRKKLAQKSAAELFKMLSGLDPQRAATIDKHNKVRLIRAVEIILTTGSPVPPQHSNILKNVGMLQDDTTKYEILKIGIKKTPPQFKKLIAERLEKRLKQGLVEEVKKLHRRGISWKRLDDLGLEYRFISQYLRGLINYEQMLRKINQASWQYAKRQMTWFKKDKRIHWVKTENEALRLVHRFVYSP